MKANATSIGWPSLFQLLRRRTSQAQLSRADNDCLVPLRVRLRPTLPGVDNRVQQHRHHRRPLPQHHLRGAPRNSVALAWSVFPADALHAPRLVRLLLQRLLGALDRGLGYGCLHASQSTNHRGEHELYKPNPRRLVQSDHAGVVRGWKEEFRRA